MQGEEEEPAEEPARKQVKEEDVFAGNKNLRSEDQKFREMHDDRWTQILICILTLSLRALDRFRRAV